MEKKIALTDIMVFTFFALVSALCFIVFLLPIEVQELLKARSDNWNLLTFFTSTFVHANFEHLVGNVLAFLLLGFIVYGLNRESNCEKGFIISMFLAISLLPFIYNLSFVLLANIIIGQPLVSCGLSTVIAGIIGLIIPSLIIFLRDMLQEKRSDLYFSSSLIFLTGSAIAFPYINFGAYNLTVFITTLTVGLALLLHVAGKLLNFAKQNLNAKKKLVTASIAILFYYTFLFSLFPSNIVMPQGNIVNIFAHYIGVFYGIISGIYTLNVLPKNKKMLKIQLPKINDHGIKN
ncbi:rhomboid family intramembrane serine protease [Candidatus Bathyarchaeota archaeon]|nr:rhomboid family intramembrane serine protease [Candidatus Bathyarchaeota archaeon]